MSHADKDKAMLIAEKGGTENGEISERVLGQRNYCDLV
jgi:hypothetical protein